LVELFDRYPDTGLAFDNVEYFSDPRGDLTHFREGIPSDNQLLISRAKAEILSSQSLSLQDIFIDNLITGPSSVLRKDAFTRVGGYDRNVFVVGDLHLFYRVGAYYGIRFANYVGVQKRNHSESTTGNSPSYQAGINGLESIRKNYPDVYRRIGKRVFDKKLGRKYYRAGLYYEKTGELTKAREAYKKAMLLRKFSLRYHLEYFRALLVANNN
jgi:tetratricopeptide (TPR) repeat protein